MAGLPIIPNFGFDIPLLDELEQMVEDAKNEIRKVIDYLETFMDVDGLDYLIEQGLASILEAIPSLDILGCKDITNSEDCDLGLGVDLVRFNSIGIPEFKIGELEVEIPDDFTDVVKRLMDEISSVRDDALAIFQDVDCKRFEKRQVNIVEFVQSNFNISNDAFPIPACPINIYVCTELHFPGFNTFIDGMNERLDDILSRDRRLLDDDAFKEFAVSIPIPVGTLVDKIPFSKFMKFEKGREVRYGNDLHHEFDIKGRTVYIDMKNGPKDVGLELGLQNGKFKGSLSVGPLLEFTFGIRQKADPSIYSNKTIDYLGETSTKMDLDRFQRDFKDVESIAAILCYLDHVYVTKQLLDMFPGHPHNHDGALIKIGKKLF